jgi:calcium binding protein
MEAVVNAYNSSERAMGWYYDLDGKMKHDADRRMTLMRRGTDAMHLMWVMQAPHRHGLLRPVLRPSAYGPGAYGPALATHMATWYP